MQTDEKPLFLLGPVAGIFHWLEELLNILNGPVLMLGAGIALVDLLTDGALTVAIPPLLFAWAVSQALGIDTQLLGCFARARSVRSGWARAGWLALGGVLGFAAWQAGDVFAVQQAQHITEQQALAQIGLDPLVWLGWRAFLAVGLVALSGWTRYRPPAPVTAADERAQLERELALEPLRQQVAARRALGAVGLGRQLLTTALHGEQPDRPPTGPGTPTAAPGDRTPAEPAAEPPVREPAVREPSIRLVSSTRRGRRARATGRGKVSVERRVRALLAAEPGLSAKAIAKRLHISDSTASKYRRLLESERQGIEPAQQQMAQ